jgi:hypothetical protein
MFGPFMICEGAFLFKLYLIRMEECYEYDV